MRELKLIIEKRTFRHLVKTFPVNCSFASNRFIVPSADDCFASTFVGKLS